MNLVRCFADHASKLSDEQLACELQCVQQCALLATRTRREAALLRARCLRLELERRKLQTTAVQVSAGGTAAV